MQLIGIYIPRLITRYISLENLGNCIPVCFPEITSKTILLPLQRTFAMLTAKQTDLNRASFFQFFLYLSDSRLRQPSFYFFIW